MAYREFEQAKHYEAPDIDLFSGAMAAWQNAQAIKNQRAIQRANVMANYKADKLTEGGFSTDLDNRLTPALRVATDKAVQDIMSYGYVLPETKNTLSRIEQGAIQSKNQKLEFKALEETLTKQANEDEYLIAKPLFDDLTQRAYGTGVSDDEVNEQTRGARLSEFAQKLSSGERDYLKTFNLPKYRQDYANNRKMQIRAEKQKGQSGYVSDEKISAIFFDKNGKPGVPDEEAIKFLDSKPDVQKYFEQKVNQELLSDAKAMIGSKNNTVQIPEDRDDLLNTLPHQDGVVDLKSLSPQQTIALFRQLPSANKEAKQKPGERELELAKKELEIAQQVSLENAYDASAFNPSSQYGVTADGIQAAPGFTTGGYAGPGFTYRNTKSATNPRLRVPTKSSYRVDVNSGTVDESDQPREMSLDKVLILPVTRSGKVINIESNSAKEFNEKINSMSEEQFNQNAEDPIVGTTLAFRGDTYDKELIQNKAVRKLQDIEAQMVNTLQGSEDYTKLQRQYDALKYQLGNLETGFVPVNLSMMRELLGVSEMRNEIMPVRPGDDNVSALKAATGQDVYDEKYWTPEMKQAKELINSRAKGFSKQKNIEEKASKTEEAISKIQGKSQRKDTPVSAKSQEDIDNLAPGTEFVWIDGNTYVKD